MRILLPSLVCLALLVPPPMGAHAEEKAKEKEKEKEVDTEFIFGFTEGADVGELGEKELEHVTIARLDKRNGSYAGIADQLRYETVPLANFRFEIGAPVSVHNIAGVTGLNDRAQAAFDGLLAQLRYRLLDREHAPFAFTVSAEPHWSRVDETSGEAVDNYGSELTIAVDRELIKNRVFGAVNFLYDPEVTRSRVTGVWLRESTLGLFASVTTQLRPGIFVGAEARYLRKYEGLAPDAFAGEALFIGPTMFARFSKTFAVSGSWGVQAAGRAAGDWGALDLTNFTRHQATFRLEYNF
jgi:hypothetical protein